MDMEGNEATGKGAVDWSRPIEAVHEDGRVMPMAVRGTPNPYGPVATTMSPDPELTNEFWYKDGGDYCAVRSGWHIRNVPEHPTPTQYAPELVERMVALARRVAASEPFWVEEVEAEARSIVSDLPQEVDPDLIEARRIASGWLDCPEEAHDGGYDSSNEVCVALACIKRGRQLERGEAA